MKFLKNILSFVVPLVIVLSTFALYDVTTKTVADYKNNIIDDYAIMVVSKTPLLKDDIEVLGGIDVKTIESLKREDIVKSLKNKLSTNSLELLKKKLPFFYKIYLDDYPTTTQLKNITQDLHQISNIKRVETFSSDHNKIYSLLILCEKIVQFILVFIVLFAVLILYKQITIWFYENTQRITIIQYHGGSILYSAMPIIKLSLLSSAIASIIVIGAVFGIQDYLPAILSPEILNLLPNHHIEINFIQTIILSFIISMISIFGVLIKQKIN